MRESGDLVVRVVARVKVTLEKSERKIWTEEDNGLEKPWRCTVWLNPARNGPHLALPRNETDWFEHLPEDITSRLLHKLYYGHFFCHVFHQDYIVKKGHDPLEIEHAMWKILDSRGAEYPAEHNVGHLYLAKPALLNHYRSLDPSNSFNPGIGQTSKHAHWA